MGWSEVGSSRAWALGLCSDSCSSSEGRCKPGVQEGQDVSIQELGFLKTVALCAQQSLPDEDTFQDGGGKETK